MENVNWQQTTFLRSKEKHSNHRCKQWTWFWSNKSVEEKGAHIIMTARKLAEREWSFGGSYQERKSKCKIRLNAIDLADFYSIRNFSNEFHSQYSKLDVLVNNTGVMNPPKREVTKQHFSVHLALII